MKRFVQFVILGFIALLGACQSQLVVVDSAMFTVDNYTNRYAKGFRILSLPDSSAMLLCVGDERRERELVMINDGQMVVEEFNGVVICGEARRIISLSSSALALLDSLGEVGRIVGLSRLDTLMSDVLHRNFGRGRLLELGVGVDLNYDAMVALHPDVILLDGASEGADSVAVRLGDLGLPYLYINDSEELSQFAQEEWLVVIAMILGRVGEGRRYFDAADARYDSLLMAEVGFEFLTDENTPQRDSLIL